MSMTATTPGTLALLIDAEECRRSLKLFAKAVWPIVEPKPFVDGWCLDAIVEHLEAVARGHIRKIVINIPPRHTKSLMLVIWRAWLWTQQPEAQILGASYSYALSIRDTLRVRRILEDPWFVERYGKEFQMAGDQNVKSYFENTKRGYQMALSVDGGTTGQGGSYLVLDDAHNATEAHSDIERAAAVTWFREVWTNRLNDQEKDKMVVEGQRIHENDICGYILKERPDWVHLNLPAEYEPSRHCTTIIGWTDPRQTEGELLWPQRFSKVTLDGLKRDLGSSGYAAQYQQSPVPSGGGMFQQKWFRYFEETEQAYILNTPGQTPKAVLKSQCRTFGTIDLAISSKQTADYTVMCVWTITPEHDLLLLHVLRDRLSNAEQLSSLHVLNSRFRPDFWKVETVAYQLAFFQQAVAEGIPCKEYKPTRDKVSRASTASVWSQNGKSYTRQGASWLAEWEAEHLSFPKGSHDDQVDNHGMAADEVCTPHGPLIWSPDTLDGDVVEEQVRQFQLHHPRIEIDDPPVPAQLPTAFDWDFDQGTMIDFDLR